MQGQAHLFNKINNNVFIIYFSNKIKVIKVNTQIKVSKSAPLAQNKLRGYSSMVEHLAAKIN